MTSHTLIAYTRMFLNVSKQESRIHYKVIKRAQVIQLTKCHLRVDSSKLEFSIKRFSLNFIVIQKLDMSH